MKKQQIDTENLAQVPQLQDYEQKPVQNYGMSLLRGMGFDQSKGIGKRKSNQLSEIFVLKPRPKGLGLGAQTLQQKQIQKLEVGDKVLITQQPHKGLIGYVNEELNNSTYQIELYPSKSKVKVQEKKLKKISKKQMKQLQKQQQKQKEKQTQRKKRRLKWIAPNIRVKITNPKSTHYLKKVIVTDLITDREFQCRDQKGNILTNLLEQDVQTALPKVDGIVLILKGDHKGCKAKLLQRKKSKGLIVIQTLEQLQILNISEDDVAQFVEL